MVTRRGRRTKTHPDEIISAARALFAKQGFHQTSTQEIGKALGVCKASMYHYFPDKERLLCTVASQICNELIEEFKQAAQEDGVRTPQQRVAALVKTTETIMFNDIGRREAGLLIETLGSTPRIKTVAQEFLKAWANVVAVLLMHRLRPHSAYEKASNYVIEIQGATIMLELFGDGEPLYRANCRLRQELA